MAFKVWKAEKKTSDTEFMVDIDTQGDLVLKARKVGGEEWYGEEWYQVLWITSTGIQRSTTTELKSLGLNMDGDRIRLQG